MTEAIISIRNVTKKFGNFTALENISIDIQPGEIYAILGPSGCGKSTLLRIISGFEYPTEGELLLDGVDMTTVPPNKRPVNMVFQSYAVFPHMSVAKNVAYGLKMQGTPKNEIDQLVDGALEQVHLSQFKHRMPNQLSGGQRQRVALARALVKKPRVLLLDEPLSALDAKLRDAMRLELVKLQDSVGVTFVIVTHDQSEALAMADRIAVLENGYLRQEATPVELYQQPNDAFVADFIGSINFFHPINLQVDENELRLKTPELGEFVFKQQVITLKVQQASDVVIAIRPEKINVTRQQHDEVRLVGSLGDIAYQGQNSIVEVRLDNERSITALIDQAQAQRLRGARTGEKIYCSWADDDMLVLPNTVN